MEFVFYYFGVFCFLTWYSAFYDKVTDCGCFGDAVKLTPWETFNKNILLIVLIGFLIFSQKRIKPFLSKKRFKMGFFWFVNRVYVYHISRIASSSNN